MLQKTVNICGKEVNFRSSASVPRLYRACAEAVPG